MALCGLTADKNEVKDMKKIIFKSLFYIYITIFILGIIFFTTWRVNFKIQEEIAKENYSCEFL